MTISFNYLKPVRLQAKKLKAFVEEMFKKEGISFEALSYVFCSDEELLEINRTYLNHDFYTDIITFDLSDQILKQAEIYISIDRVKENAKKFNTPFNTELHRVIFHGVLHLCGYKDKTAKQSTIMRSMEDKYVNDYFK